MIEKFNWKGLMLLCISGAISVFYVLKINGKNMREIPVIKIHLIAVSWVFVLFLFPIFNESISLDFLSIALPHYLYIVAVTIPFDIRDLKYDDPSHKTIPQLIGFRKSKMIAVLLLLIFYFVMVYFNSDFLVNWLFLIAVIVQIIFLIRMKATDGDFYCAGFFDGAIALLGLSYFMQTML